LGLRIVRVGLRGVGVRLVGISIPVGVAVSLWVICGAVGDGTGVLVGISVAVGVLVALGIGVGLIRDAVAVRVALRIGERIEQGVEGVGVGVPIGIRLHRSRLILFWHDLGSCRIGDDAVYEVVRLLRGSSQGRGISSLVAGPGTRVDSRELDSAVAGPVTGGAQLFATVTVATNRGPIMRLAIDADGYRVGSLPSGLKVTVL